MLLFHAAGIQHGLAQISDAVPSNSSLETLLCCSHSPESKLTSLSAVLALRPLQKEPTRLPVGEVKAARQRAQRGRGARGGQCCQPQRRMLPASPHGKHLLLPLPGPERSETDHLEKRSPKNPTGRWRKGIHFLSVSFSLNA